MSTFDAHPSDNGRGSDAWSWSFTDFRLDRPSAACCRVTFNYPPINSVTATTVAELVELVGLIEQDADLSVVVFHSANPDYYLTDDDTAHDSRQTAALPRGPTGLHAWPDVLVRLARAPVVSIAAIRGRVRGAGSEFVLACDLRFASRENTRLDHGEIRADAAIEGSGTFRLPRLIGRGRALELLLVAGHLDGPRAERYGYVNRLIADAQLDDEVDQIAARIARFDHAIARTKAYVDRVTRPAGSEPSAAYALPDA